MIILQEINDKDCGANCGRTARGGICAIGGVCGCCVVELIVVVVGGGGGEEEENVGAAVGIVEFYDGD
uniref:Candidate secreted effector n=1 Tax=Meloidogyne incognita TaxID=6306 RepID=A0A914MFC7_MELIC